MDRRPGMLQSMGELGTTEAPELNWPLCVRNGWARAGGMLGDRRRLETTHPWGPAQGPCTPACSSPFHLQISPLTSTPFLLLCLPFRSPCFCLLPIKYCFPSQPLFHSHGAWPTPSLLGSRLGSSPWCRQPMCMATSQPPLHSPSRRGGGEAPFPHRPHHCHHQRCWPATDLRVCFPSPPLCGPLRGGGHILLFLPPDSLLNLFCSFSSFTWPRVQALMMGIASSLFSSLLLPTCHPCHPPNHSIHPSCRDQESLSKADPAFSLLLTVSDLPSTSRAESLPLASPLRPFRVDLHLLSTSTHRSSHASYTFTWRESTPLPKLTKPIRAPPLALKCRFLCGGSPFFSLPPLAYSFLKVQAKCLFFDRDFLTFSGVQDEATVAR